MSTSIISVAFQYTSRRISRKETERVIQCVLAGEGIRRYSVSVVFVSNVFIRSINKRFLSHNTMTDVIAFPLGDDQVLQGELYVNIQQVAAQAKEFGVTILNELRRLLVHGALHLVGYSDTDPQSKVSMMNRENLYLSQLEKKASVHARKNY